MAKSPLVKPPIPPTMMRVALPTTPKLKFPFYTQEQASRSKGVIVSDLSFYYALNTDNQINYGPVLENIVYFYAKSRGYNVSVGRIGKLECDFILRSPEINYAYEVIDAINLAKAQGKGAISLRGKMIDAPIVARAERTIAMAAALGLAREVE